MSSASRRLLALALVTGLAAPSAAFATNGYFLIGFGAKSRGMGGVGVAYGQDGLAAAANPAAMADVPVSTMRFDVGADLFVPRRGAVLDSAALNDSTAPNINVVSESNLFLIPNMGGIYRFTPNITIGMAVVGAGLGTRYDQHVPGNPTCYLNGPNTGGKGSYLFNYQCLASPTAGVSLMQMQMLPSIAYRIDKVNTVGMSIAFAVQQFRAYGLQAFGPAISGGLGFSSPTSSGHLTNEGNDWSYGAGIRLGWIGHFLNDRVRLGANWSSRVYMTRFRKYTNLFAQNGTFDIPMNYSLGILLRPTKKIDVAFDWQRILWSSVRSVGNPGPNPANPNQFFPAGYSYLGADNGLGFGWKDRNVYKLGVDYKYNDRLTLRAGFNYSKAPIPSDQVLFNILAPATVERHVTLGFSYQQTPAIQWSFSYVHAFKKTIKGPTVFGPSSAPVVGENASIALVENAVGVSFGYGF